MTGTAAFSRTRDSSLTAAQQLRVMAVTGGPFTVSADGLRTYAALIDRAERDRGQVEALAVALAAARSRADRAERVIFGWQSLIVAALLAWGFSNFARDVGNILALALGWLG